MNYDEDSDLTDLESDDEFQEPSSQKKAKKAATTYNLRNTLKVPRATTYAAQALFDQMASMDIDLNAEYQRDVVWPDSKQISLIDSIYRNFYVPPVIFATKQHDDGSETKICIDGKQRLTSIRRFMDGQIPHKDALTAEKWWYKASPPGEKPRKVLPEKLRRIFANKQIVCVEYQDITETDEREVFQRVQLGMALTPAEKLQVTNTPRSAFVRDLVNDYVKENGGGLSRPYLDWEHGRGGDFRCLSQALLALDKWRTVKTIGTIQQLDKWLANPGDLEDAFMDEAKDTFRIFSELARDENLGVPLRFPTKLSPIEFIGISILIGIHRTKLTKAQLSTAIGNLRTHLRKEHVDVRMNSRVSRDMLEYIRKLKPSQFSADSAPVASKTNAKGTTKRKRPSNDDDMDIDDAEDDDEDDAEYSERSSKTKKSKKAKPISSKPKQTRQPVTRVKEEPETSSMLPPPPPLPASSRLAALRATDAGTSSQPPLPSLQMRTSTSRVSSQPSTPQLPSPGQTFTFPTALGSVTGNGPYQNSLHQAQAQQQGSSSSRPPNSASGSGYQHSNSSASGGPRGSANGLK